MVSFFQFRMFLKNRLFSHRSTSLYILVTAYHSRIYISSLSLHFSLQIEKGHTGNEILQYTEPCQHCRHPPFHLQQSEYEGQKKQNHPHEHIRHVGCFVTKKLFTFVNVVNLSFMKPFFILLSSLRRPIIKI